MTPELPRRAILTDLRLHDALSTGLDNPLAARPIGSTATGSR